MYRVSATVRISAALVSLTVCAMMLAELLGLLPDRQSAVMEGRIALTESIAVSCSLAARRHDLAEIETILAALAQRNSSVASAGFRLSEGALVVDVGQHRRGWDEAPAVHRMHVPLTVEGRPWGAVELTFTPPDDTVLGMLAQSSLLRMMFVSSVCSLGFFWYLRRVLQHLDPSRVIPDRVRTTLDTLAEGLLVFDRNERVVMANSTFANVIGRPADELLGKSSESLPWASPAEEGDGFPWTKSISSGTIQTDCRLRVNCESGVQRVFKVNTAPILSDDGSNRGALATFSDVTELELRNSQLHETLTKLERSREQIRRHNEQLRTLATRDPLTGCLNRRAFFEEAEKELRSAEIKSVPISYIIFDIDHFKSINDNHGHAVGDEVLKAMGKLVEARFQESGVVCRYGGEEFSVLLPRLDIQQAAQVGESLRAALESTSLSNLKITSSVGVAQLKSLTPNGLREVMEQADKALYAAKRGGRNQVKRWDEIKDLVIEKPAQGERTAVPATSQIPFTVVSALSSALYYRDPPTAEHCRRVANLAASAARGMMSEEKRYVLEVAALLHDIGKLGVPDAVLHKPGPLTEDEWKVMKTYQNVGRVIIENAFTCPDLVTLVRTYSADFGGPPEHPDLPVGKEIPIGARLLKIADAFDAMVNSQAYRSSMTRKDAYAELRRCAGTQFDPQLVEHLIETVESSAARDELQVANMDRRIALQLGLETEKLACALDARDRLSLKDMVARLKTVAERNGLDKIRELTADVESLVEADADWLAVLSSAADLLDTCRLAQWACVVDQQTAMST